MKKITLLLAFTLITFYANAQFTTGEVTLTSGMTVEIETQAAQVTLTLKGPTNKWFAVGFGGNSMSSTTDAFLLDSSNNYDRTIGGHFAPSADANQDWTLVSNNIVGSQRVIIATRALSTSDSSDYTFSNSSSTIPVIWAKGDSMSLDYHVSRGTSSLSRTAVADVDKQKQIQFAMYPNPVNSELNIVLPSNLDNAQVEIYNVLGKKISSKNLNDSFNKLNVSTLSTGIYLIKIIGDNNTFGVKQFVKK